MFIELLFLVKYIYSKSCLNAPYLVGRGAFNAIFCKMFQPQVNINSNCIFKFKLSTSKYFALKGTVDTFSSKTTFYKATFPIHDGTFQTYKFN